MEGLVFFLISVEIGFNHFREGEQYDHQLDRVSSKSIRFLLYHFKLFFVLLS